MASTSSKRDEINAIIDAECPVCQCVMVMPTAVPSCGHKFCFLCLKGVSLANFGGCPICRRPIDTAIFKKPSTQNLDLKMEAPRSPVVDAPADPAAPTENPVKTEDDEDVKPDVDALNATVQNAAEPKMYWLYEGRHSGWWRFDPRLEKDIDEAYVNQMPLIEATICGHPYIIDFTEMKQFSKNQRDTSRQIKRVDAAEFDALDVKGLAGMLAK